MDLVSGIDLTEYTLENLGKQKDLQVKLDVLLLAGVIEKHSFSIMDVNPPNYVIHDCHRLKYW